MRNATGETMPCSITPKNVDFVVVNGSLPNSRNFSRRHGLTLLLAAALSGGCGQDGIKAYTVPKEEPAQAAPGNLPADHPDVGTAAAAPQLKWTTPVGWKELQPGEFRVASFKVTNQDGKQADVSVIPFPGDAGGDFSNVNRWRGQVGQPPVSEEELKTLAQPVELAGQPATLYEQNGENPAGEPTRILAVVQHRDGMAWFFKMTGDSQLVAQQKSAFVEFLKSVQFVAGAAMEAMPATSAPMPGGTLPAGHPDISATPPGAPSVGVSSAGRPQWTVPPGWEEVPGGQFLVAKFTITGAGNAQAAVNVSSSAGNGGGLAANVNRWRKQLGLGELSNDELAKVAKVIETTSGQATLVEMNGQDARSGQATALVGVMVVQPGQAWFYKLMGNAQIVEAQKDAFTKFVQEAKY